MKQIILFTAIWVAVFGLFACNGGSTLPDSVLGKIPQKYDINDPVFRHAKEELEELVGACGPGIVEGAGGENRCNYTVKMDEIFFTHPSDKTGFNKDPLFAFKSGIVFYTAPKMLSLPQKWDLRDFQKNSPPPIRTQHKGSCWAQSTTDGWGETVAAFMPAPIFSVQSVINCSGEGTAAGGGSMDAPNMVVASGLPPESEYPTDEHDGKCKYTKDEMAKGWQPRPKAAPYVGQAINYSRFFHGVTDESRQASIEQIMEAMVTQTSGAVMDLSAFSQSGGTIMNCSYGGINHMEVGTGFERIAEDIILRLRNSWGKGHGEAGYGRIKWNCPGGKKNRYIGDEARVYIRACQPPDISMPATSIVLQGNALKVGRPQPADVKCSWLPANAVEDANACQTYFIGTQSTELHLKASSSCGEFSSMMKVNVIGPVEKTDRILVTPFGTIPDTNY